MTTPSPGEMVGKLNEQNLLLKERLIIERYRLRNLMELIELCRTWPDKCVPKREEKK